ncbi:hypothetical protein ACEPAF_7522 [Sanghuangporus sanghuang]
MVGTPQLALKYRRKGTSDYRVRSHDLDMPFHTSASSLNSYRFASECSMPRSPSFCSSSSVAPSSPIRSLYSPEPSSSPIAEPYIASSPKSPTSSGRKGFWEVAFNYGPDFPYKARPCVQTSNFSREQFITRRRSSSASAPPLVSDADPSDYSEDIDPFHTDDDITDGEGAAGNVTIANSRDELVLVGRQDSHLPHNDITEARNNDKLLPGEMDVAAVLLDLSRQPRFTSTESKTEDTAIKPKLPLSLDSVQPPSKDLDVSVQTGEVAHTSISVAPESPVAASSCNVAATQDFEVFRLDGHEIIGQSSHSEPTRLFPGSSEPATDVFASDQDQNGSTGEDGCPSEVERAQACVDMSSENVVTKNVENTVPPQAINVSKLTTNKESYMIVNEERMDPIVESIFSCVLTPISSPSLAGSELSDLTELLSEPPSPRNDVVDGLMGPASDMRHLRESSELDTLYGLSSAPGPKGPRSGTVDQHDALTERKSGRFEKGVKDGRGRNVHDVKTVETEQNELDLQSKKKRARSGSSSGSRSSSPGPSASCSVIPKPQKKSKRAGDRTVSSWCEDEDQSMNSAHRPSLPNTSTPSASASSAPPDLRGDAQLPVAPKNDDADATNEMCGCLIQTMALSRASSMPASSLVREVLRENPHLANQRSKSDWFGVASVVLESNDVFGRIDRVGFDADDKPLEAQWFYIPENDPDCDRASLLREMMPKKRNETKKYKQYFFKPLGKISRWDPEDAL